jgi:hypothetical protein
MKERSRKSVKVQLRVSPVERDALSRAAQSEGLELSLWARRLLFRAAGLDPALAYRPDGRPPGCLMETQTIPPSTFTILAKRRIS